MTLKNFKLQGIFGLKYIYIIFIAFAFLVSGCYIPEKFTAKVTITKNGDYTIKYDGTMLAIVAIGEKLSKRDEKSLAEDAQKIAKDPNVKNIKYLGKGRYKLYMSIHNKSHQKGYIFGKDLAWLKVIPKENNSFLIITDSMEPKDVYEIKKAGVKIDGKLVVSVPRDMKVTSNIKPSSTPSFFGLVGDYEWNIKSFLNKIIIKVVPKK